MSEELDASVPESGALANEGGSDAPDSGSTDPFGELNAFFEAGTKVDNQTDATAEPAVEDTPEPEPEAETKPAGEEEPATEEEEAADFDALNRKVDYLTDRDAIKARFPRNLSKEAVEYMLEAGNAAKEGIEALEAIGGKEFVPGVSQITTGLKDGDPRAVLAGIANTGGAEELVKVAGDLLYMSLVEGDNLKQTPVSAAFGEALEGMVDAALQEKFGPQMSVDRMSKLAQYDTAGWFDKIEEWMKAEFIDPDEFGELVNATKNPQVIALKNRIAELEGQQKQPKSQNAQSANFAEIENSFGKVAAEGIGKTLNEVVWQRSPLRDLPSDSDDTKAEKAFLREALIDRAVEHFRSGEKAKNLLNAYKSGKASTAVFRTNLAEAINDSILATKQTGSIVENLLAKIIGKQRNTQLATKRPQAQAAATNGTPLEPTQTTNFATDEPKTRADVAKMLDEDLLALASNHG